jgi:hypothetical protein
MNVKIETEAAQFLSWEYLFRAVGIVSWQCLLKVNLTFFDEDKDLASCEGQLVQVLLES